MSFVSSPSNCLIPEITTIRRKLISWITISGVVFQCSRIADAVARLIMRDPTSVFLPEEQPSETIPKADSPKLPEIA